MVGMKKQDAKRIEKIAKEVLCLETLETRNMDDLDFHENAVWTIRKALEAAYEAGQKSVGGSK
jgi:hypothetical protein